jgi:hypothetical protein
LEKFLKELGKSKTRTLTKHDFEIQHNRQTSPYGSDSGQDAYGREIIDTYHR